MSDQTAIFLFARYSGGVELPPRVRLYPRSVEYLLLALLAWFGLFLLFPAATFERVPAYSELLDVMPENGWGAVLLLVASVHAFGMVLAFRGLERSVGIRRAALLLNAAWWAYISFQFGQHDSGNTGVGTYALLSLAAAWAYLDAGDDDDGGEQ